ncbi:MAG: DNA polymerase II [Candidatus Woesearchaeota archaeon]
MRAFVVYPTYRIIDNRALVYLFGRLENGESFLTINEYKPYFFIRKSDEDKARKIAEKNTIFEESDFKNFDDELMTKIVLNIPSDVKKLRDLFEEEKIETFESDIRFVQRFMIDNKIKGSTFIDGEFKKGEYVNRIYENPRFKEEEWFPRLKIVSIDIETDMKAKEIYCISVYCEDYKRVLIRSKEELKNAKIFDTEKEMLEHFKELIIKLDPDIITGWNVIDFDLKILKQRFDYFKIPFVFGRTDWPCTIKIEKEFMKESTAEFPGRMILNGINVLKINFYKLEDYTLETAAQEVLHMKKLIGEENKGEEIEKAFKYDKQKLVDYNLLDSEMVYIILEKTKTLDLSIQRSLLTGMTLDKVRASVASLDSVYLRETKKRKLVCFNSKFIEKETSGVGGYVMDSIPGLYENIVVVDFKSLYPSIIKTFNIDPYSFVRHPEKIPEKDKKDIHKYVRSPNNAYFKNQDGILPILIHNLWEKREAARKQKNELARYAIKILMNSFYGVLGNPSCRFYNMDINNAITTFGQYLIKLTAKKIEEKGYRVIYSDTDSAFVETKASTREEAEKIGREIQYYINKFYEDFVRREYARKSYLELEFEKVFIKFLMPRIRGSEEGAKKRYAGLLIENGKEVIKFTGMEFVRSDWTELSKIFQEELLDKIFHNEEVADFIKKFVANLENGRYDDKLVYKKKINKPLSEYIKTTPPHVKAARKLGKLKSNLIQYVMTTDGPEPIEKIKHKIDYNHYVDKQLEPIADSLLVFFDKSFKEILKNSKQTSLFGY